MDEPRETFWVCSQLQGLAGVGRLTFPFSAEGYLSGEDGVER